MSCGVISASRLGFVAQPLSSTLIARSWHRGAPAWPRKMQKRVASPPARGAFDLRTAGIWQAQHLRDLVEGLADGVVDRGAESHILADAGDCDDLGMAAAEARNRQ